MHLFLYAEILSVHILCSLSFTKQLAWSFGKIVIICTNDSLSEDKIFYVHADHFVQLHCRSTWLLQLLSSIAREQTFYETLLSYELFVANHIAN